MQKNSAKSDGGNSEAKGMGGSGYRTRSKMGANDDQAK
jgi:hypothetical protein